MISEVHHARRLLAGAALLASASFALADEPAVRRMVEDRLRGSGQVEGVQKMPLEQVRRLLDEASPVKRR